MSTCLPVTAHDLWWWQQHSLHMHPSFHFPWLTHTDEHESINCTVTQHWNAIEHHVASQTNLGSFSADFLWLLVCTLWTIIAHKFGTILLMPCKMGMSEESFKTTNHIDTWIDWEKILQFELNKTSKIYCTILVIYLQVWTLQLAKGTPFFTSETISWL
jgi:hypothetical protein